MSGSRGSLRWHWVSTLVYQAQSEVTPMHHPRSGASMALMTALLLLPCGVTWAQPRTSPPNWGATSAGPTQPGSPSPTQRQLAMPATPAPLQAPLLTPPAPAALPASAAARQQPTQTAGSSVLPEGLQSPEAQTQHLQRRMQALEARLAATEKALATHRHAYQGVAVNQYNYKTLRYLLEHSDSSDGLLNWPSMPRTMQTSPPQADAP